MMLEGVIVGTTPPIALIIVIKYITSKNCFIKYVSDRLFSDIYCDRRLSVLLVIKTNPWVSDPSSSLAIEYSVIFVGLKLLKSFVKATFRNSNLVLQDAHSHINDIQLFVYDKQCFSLTNELVIFPETWIN